MKKGVLILLLLFLCLAELFAQAASEETWTVFVYLCGTDLESDGGAASDNLIEMAQVDVPANIRVLIQTGGTQEWQLEGYFDPNKLQRFLLEDNDLTLIGEQPPASMGDSATLGSFLAFGAETYPADRYMAVLWDHGGGSVTGVCFDELFDMDSLSLAELAQAFETAGIAFDVIGFDACLMATLESAAALAPYARYIVASEEYEPGGGWDYTAWLSKLCEDPGMDGAEIGKVICDSYYRKCESSNDESMSTLSVIDLEKVPSLVGAFDAMAYEMNGVASDLTAFKNLRNAVRKAENYGGNNAEEGFSNMVDLGDLAINAEDVLSETAVKVLDTLFEAVEYQVKGESRSNANGISVFYPLSVSRTEELDTYGAAAVSGNYLRFVRTVAGYTSALDFSGWDPSSYETYANSMQSPSETALEVLDPSAYGIEFTTYISDDGYYTLEITGGLEAAASVQFALSYMDHEYNEYMELGVDNDIEADWEKGIFRDNFRGVWAAVNGEYCAPILIADENNYNLYTVPILLNGQEGNLRVRYVFEGDEGHYEILGVWSGLDNQTGMSGRDILKLKAGDEVAFLFSSYSWETEEYTNYEAETILIGEETVMEEIKLIDAAYEYYYLIEDVFGNVYYSDPVMMTCENGEIYLQGL